MTQPIKLNKSGPSHKNVKLNIAVKITVECVKIEISQADAYLYANVIPKNGYITKRDIVVLNSITNSASNRYPALFRFSSYFNQFHNTTLLLRHYNI